MIETRDLLLHPIRLRIVQALVGEPMTPLQLKDRLADVPQATLYRHINQLADVAIQRRLRHVASRSFSCSGVIGTLTRDCTIRSRIG